MKKILIISMISILTFGFIAPLFATDNPGDKLIRGTVNIVSCVLEVPKQIDIEWKASKNATIGIFAGLFKGMAYGIGRLYSGVYDLVTFPVNVPKDYEPLMKPDFVFGE